MEFKGTKGEWEVCSNDVENIGDCLVIFSKERKNSGIKGYPYALISVISPFTNLDNEDLLNAKLIAAAPELLKALQGLVFEIDDCAQPSDWDTYKQAKEAINKALN